MAAFDVVNKNGIYFDPVTGTTGDDTFTLHEGGAIGIIDGLAGIDTVSFGKAQSYRYGILPADSDGVVEVDSVSGASWVYAVLLKNIEFVTFDSGSTVIDVRAWGHKIVGTSGNDNLVGGAAGEYLIGGAGNDTINGGGGNDYIYGGIGPTIDTNGVLPGDPTSGIVAGGPGVNTAVYSGPHTNYTFNLQYANTVTDNFGNEGTDTLKDVQILKFADLSVHYALTGTLITAVGGNDIVHVTNVAVLNATVVAPWTAGAESYNDSFSGSGSYATISTPGISVDLSAITAGKGYNLTNSGAGTTLKGSGLDDTLTLSVEGAWGTGYAARNDGSPGVAGTGQQIALDGKHRFSDLTDGSGGSDTLQLPDGGNAFFLHDAYSLFSSGTALANDSRGMPSTARLGNIEVIHAGAGNDIIDLTSPNYAIAGVLIDGGAGNDTLWGNAGDDTILGGEGNDTLFGGAGHNTLSGGAGSDSFQYVKTGTAHDILQDFLPGTDLIQLFGAASIAEVTVAMSGGHVLLTWGTQTIELTGITSTAGSNGWFQLG